MASHNDSFVPDVSIVAIQTVTTTRITEPRQTRQVLASDLVGSGIFQRCYNMVQYYIKENEQDSGWLVAGWMKDTLMRASSDQPMICGRLRHTERNYGELEIVTNDCGVRLIEATSQRNLSEFLDSKGREKAEAQLVFWRDIDEQNPQFSPLVYVQVTNFQCGGYTIGISCSILLVDLLIRARFLKTWADIHSNVINMNHETKLPLFYLPGLKNTSTGPSVDAISSSTSDKNSGKTMIFKINAESKLVDFEWCRQVALACIEDSKNDLGIETGAEFCLFMNESFGVIKVESCTKQGMLKPNMEVTRAKWDDLGVNDVSFRQGNKPARVSHWFRLISGGVVVVIPSTAEVQGACIVDIIITIPKMKY